MANADREFVERVTAGEYPAKVYRQIYGEDGKMVNKVKDALSDEDIKGGIKERLKSDGITLQGLNRRLKDKLVAKKIIYYDPKLSKDIVDDNMAQLDAIKTGYKLLGALKDKDTYIDNRQVTFSGDLGQLAKVVAEMKAMDREDVTDIDGEVV